MKDLETIIEFIESNSTEIVENIETESIEVYSFLKEQFEKSNVTGNYLFQFVYRNFYRLDNAGLTSQFKTEYFKILEENRNNKIFHFDEILKRLYNFPNRKGQNTLQFSFVTKMLNTIDNKMPIYDSEVAKMFSVSRPNSTDFEKKLDLYLEQLNVIQESYEQIINHNKLPNVSQRFDEKFKSHNLDEMKKLDFIFWSAGKIKKKYQNSGDDGFHTLKELDKLDRIEEIKNRTQNSSL